MKLRLREKLLGGFGAVIVLLAAVAVMSILKLNQAAQTTADLYTQNLLGVLYSGQTNTEMVKSAREEKRAFLAADKTQQADLIAKSRAEMAEAKANLEKYHISFVDDADARQWAEVEAKVNKVSGEREAVLKLLEQGDDAGAMKAAVAMGGLIDDMNASIDKAAELNSRLANESQRAAAASASSARTVLIVLSVVAGAMGLGIGYWLARSIAGAAKQAATAATAISRGDVNVSMEVKSSDEMGDLARSFSDMTGYLQEMVGVSRSVAAGDLSVEVPSRGPQDALGNALTEMTGNLRSLVSGVQSNAQSILSASNDLRDASDQMAGATGQIATAINDVTRSAVALSGLSQDSAREIEQVAAGSQELAAAAESNASSAAESRAEAARMTEQILTVATASGEVARSAEESRTAAIAGQQAVQQAVASMQSIAAAVERASRTVDQLGSYSNQIGDIVKAIDEIAAQTNLLALNAAIEAARAGEQGRGFAVVADNVRQLAERSSQSTKEIADLIARVQSGTEEAVEAMSLGVRDVESGREITTRAGEALDSIIASVQQSALRMQTIASDVQGLASGAQRIVASAETIAGSARESAQGAGEMASGTTRVTEAIIQVSATSEETSASAEEVSASTEQLSAQSEELAATANQMKELAEQLANATSRFRLEHSRG